MEVGRTVDAEQAEVAASSQGRDEALNVDENLHSWERTKENVLPSKRGRNIDSLRSFASQQHDTGRAKMLEMQRQAFETTIAEATSLGPWLRYIQWTQSQYPEGGVASGILLLLEKCCNKFKADPDYRNDPRFLEVWIMYVDLTDNPDDIFKFLHKQAIFEDLGLFYTAWA